MKRGPKLSGKGLPPPWFGQCPKVNVLFLGRSSGPKDRAWRVSRRLVFEYWILWHTNSAHMWDAYLPNSSGGSFDTSSSTPSWSPAQKSTLAHFHLKFVFPALLFSCFNIFHKQMWKICADNSDKDIMAMTKSQFKLDFNAMISLSVKQIYFKLRRSKCFLTMSILMRYLNNQ